MTFTQLYAVLCVPLLLAAGAYKLLFTYTDLDDPLVYAASAGAFLAFSVLGFEVERHHFRERHDKLDNASRMARFILGLPVLYSLSLCLGVFSYAFFSRITLLIFLGLSFLGLTGGLWFLLKDNQIRGRRVYTQRYMERIGRANLPQGDRGFPFAGVPIAMKDNLHRAYIGTTGSGKTTAIKQDMAYILPLIGKGPDSLRAAIWDPTTELFGFVSKIAKCPVYTTHPFDKRGRSWAMCKDIRTPKAALQFAVTLIPREEGPNSYFSNGARVLVRAVLLSFILNSPDFWTFRDVLLACESETVLRAVLGRNKTTRRAIAKFLDAKEKTSVLSTLEAFIDEYAPMAACWSKAEPISLREFCEGNFILVFAQDEESPESLALINGLMIRYLSQQLLSQKTNEELKREGKPQRHSFIFLDELRELAGRLPIPLTALLTRGRKYGVTCINGWQSRPGMVDALNPNRAAEIIAMHSLIGMLRVQDEDSKAFSEIVGEREVERTTKTTSSSGNSYNSQIVRETIALPTNFSELATGEGYFLAPTPLGLWKTRLPPPVKEVHDETVPPNFDPRPEYGKLREQEREIDVNDPDQWLEPWNKDDLKRLKLPDWLLDAEKSRPKIADPQRSN
jgi:type IV secretory pathway TraG/TraD family ATPase VirD4